MFLARASSSSYFITSSATNLKKCYKPPRYIYDNNYMMPLYLIAYNSRP